MNITYDAFDGENNINIVNINNFAVTSGIDTDPVPLNIGRNMIHLESNVAGTSYSIEAIRGGIVSLHLYDKNETSYRTSFTFIHSKFESEHIHVVRPNIPFIKINATFYGNTIVKAGNDSALYSLTTGEKSDNIPINIGINYLNLSTIYGGGNYTIKILRTVIENVTIRDYNDTNYVFDYRFLNGNSFVVNEDVDFIGVTLLFDNAKIYGNIDDDEILNMILNYIQMLLKILQFHMG